jgi:hypothetical protein
VLVRQRVSPGYYEVTMMENEPGVDCQRLVCCDLNLHYRCGRPDDELGCCSSRDSGRCCAGDRPGGSDSGCDSRHSGIGRSCGSSSPASSVDCCTVGEHRMPERKSRMSEERIAHFLASDMKRLTSQWWSSSSSSVRPSRS